MYRTRESINSNFAQSPLFIKACELAKIIPSKRQASRFRAKKGLAYSFVKRARQELKSEWRNRKTSPFAQLISV